MKKATFLLTVVLVLTVAFLGYHRVGFAQMSPAETVLKVGLVDVAEVLTRCQENLDREKEGQERQKQINDELEQLSQAAAAIEQELQNALKPDSPEFKLRHREWFDKQVRAQALKKYEKEVLTMESQSWTESLYEKLVTEVKRVALQKDVTLILNKDDSSLSGRSLAEMYNIILSRSVLYNAPTLDLTAQVLENMDRQYQQQSVQP